MKSKLAYMSRRSIKESFDNLETGLCYFNKNGLPILINRVMDRLTFEILDHDLRFESEWIAALKPLKNDIYFAKDGTIWQMDRKQDPEYGTEYMATNITVIYQDTKALQRKHKQLEEVNKTIEEIGRNYVAIAREEEILSMKMRVHSEMGRCGLNIRKYYKEVLENETADGKDPKSSEQKSELIRQIRDAVALLKGEVGKKDNEDSLTEFMQTAQAIGANISITGDFPTEKKAAELLIAAMRECMTNTIRHAGGDTLYIQIEKREDGYRTVLTNNGRQPEQSITEGGGLSSLRQKIEREGGTMRISVRPQFSVTVTIPAEREEW